MEKNNIERNKLYINMDIRRFAFFVMQFALS